MSKNDEAAGIEPEQDAGYEVGFKKPPKEHRFKEGNIANPRGRPKNSRNRKTIVRDELQSVIHVKEGSRTRKITKLEVIVKNTVNDAMKGNHKAREQVLKWAERYGLIMMTDGGESIELLTETDEAILADYIDRKTMDPTR